jgi:hypothetical protein
LRGWIYVGAIIGLSVRSDGLGRLGQFCPGLVNAKLLPVKENRILLKKHEWKTEGLDKQGSMIP